MPVGDQVSVITRNNVRVSGLGSSPMIFVHGYGCDQNIWRYVVPAFESDFQVVSFDLVGAGGSDPSAYDPQKYTQLDAYADDLIDICRELNLDRPIVVGHSVGAMIAVAASLKQPALFSKLILVGPSPCYIDDGDYVGGFSADQIDELLEFLDNNHMGWSAVMAPRIVGNPDRPELGEELTASFCRMDPAIARQFARVTFTSDSRAELEKVMTPTLILQCSDDILAGEAVGTYVHQRIAGSSLVSLHATGHCPHLSAPHAVIEAIRAYVEA